MLQTSSSTDNKKQLLVKPYISKTEICCFICLFVWWLTWTDIPERPCSGLHLLDLHDFTLRANQSVASVGHAGSRNSWHIIEQRQEAVICGVFLPLLEHGVDRDLCTATGLKHPGNSSGYCNRISWFPGWAKDHMNIWTSKSKGVDAHDAASNGNRSVNNLNPTIGEGGYVRVRTIEVQVGSPDSSLQRKQHLCVRWKTTNKIKTKTRWRAEFYNGWNN